MHFHLHQVPAQPEMRNIMITWTTVVIRTMMMACIASMKVVITLTMTVTIQKVNLG